MLIFKSVRFPKPKIFLQIWGSNIGLAGCGMGLKNRGGMRDTKEIRSGMRDEIILSGPGYVVFRGRDAGCFEIDGGIEDRE